MFLSESRASSSWQDEDYKNGCPLALGSIFFKSRAALISLLVSIPLLLSRLNHSLLSEKLDHGTIRTVELVSTPCRKCSKQGEDGT